jgi:drug/metabolite transporter (DMT)-like permease
MNLKLRGIVATLLSTLFSGLAPIFGKLAYQAGVQPSALVALRTALAAGLLWLFYLLFWRGYITITWRNLLGCVGMGIANGIGSLLYYNGHPVSRLAVVRLGLALLSVFLLTWQGTGAGLVDPLGITLMIGAGALYGFHLVLGQWTLADVEPRTVTLYGLTTMSVVVGIPYLATLAQGRPMEPISAEGWVTILLVAIFPTALARLLVFAGLRRLGGIQTSLLGIAEVLVALTFAFLFLGESFSPMQWLGAGLFVVSVLLIARDTSVQIADEETWWQSLFPDPASQEPGTADESRRAKPKP